MFLTQAFDKDLGAYGTVQYSIVQAESPGIFSLAPNTGEIMLSSPSALVSGKQEYILAVSAADNLGKNPHNTAKQNASVHVSLFKSTLVMKYTDEHKVNTVKTLLSSQRHIILGPKRGGLIERGSYFKS